MNSFKKAVRVLCLVLLILLASFGVSLSGSIAIPPSRKRDDTPVTIELVESPDEQPGIGGEEYKP